MRSVNDMWAGPVKEDLTGDLIGDLTAKGKHGRMCYSPDERQLPS